MRKYKCPCCNKQLILRKQKLVDWPRKIEHWRAICMPCVLEVHIQVVGMEYEYTCDITSKNEYVCEMTPL